ncbi:hypothetical protein ACQB6R_09215 [Propionibacteriaceae bacterium G1746]
MTTTPPGPVALTPDEDPFAHHEGRGGVDDPTVWLAGYLAEAEQLAAQAAAAEQAMAAQQTTVENKFMRMSMGPSGQITELVFQPSANAATAAQLTEAFQELHIVAASASTRQTMRIMQSLVSPDDPSLQAIAESVSPAVREQMVIDEAAEQADRS